MNSSLETRGPTGFRIVCCGVVFSFFPSGLEFRSFRMLGWRVNVDK